MLKRLLIVGLILQGVRGITVTGLVQDSTSNKPIPGVNIQVIGTSLGTATDDRGKFVLTVAKPLPFQIQVSHIAFYPKTVTITEATDLTILLIPTVIKSKTIEVTGARPLYKADVAADVDLIAIEDMEIQGAREVGSALRRITSVNVEYTNTGKQTITIRGSNPEDVAVYLDGVKINQANTGIADLSMIDINSLAEIQVIKGGNTTLFGGGNTGGVLNLESRHIMGNSLSVKQGIGLTFDHDADFSLSGTYKKGIVGVGGRYTGMNRAYAGRTITTSLFHNLFSDLTFSSGLLSVKWFRLEKALLFPSGGVNLADGMRLTSIKYSGVLPMTGKWELFYGNRIWSNDQDFLTSLREKIEDDTETIRVSKMIDYRVLQSTVQYEKEFQQFTGDKTQRDIAGNQIAHRLSHLTRTAHGFSSVARTVFQGSSPAVSEIRFEVGLRYDFLEIAQDDVFSFNLNPGGNETLDYLRPVRYRYDTNTTKRIGMQISGHTSRLQYEIFINQGNNHRSPTLMDYFRFSYINPEVQTDSLLGKEYLNTTEINIKTSRTDLDLTVPLSEIQIDAGIFRNNYTDKIAYLFDAGDTPVPYNASRADITGLEGSMTLHFGEDRVLLKLASTWLDISSLLVFPNRPRVQSMINLEYRQGPFTVSYDQFYYGKRYIYIPGIGEGFYDATRNANLTVSLKKDIFHISWFLNYTIRNLMSEQGLAVAENPSFNYFEQYRHIVTLQAEL